MHRLLLAAPLLLLLATPVATHAQNGPAAAPLRDPALPYASWGEAARETAAAIGDGPLAQPADARYAVGDAVIFDDGGKRYRAHVIGIESGSYLIHYDGFGPDWKRRVTVDALLGYQPGYTPKAAAPGATAARAPEVGDEMEVESKGKWHEGRVIAVEAGRYRVHYDGQPKSADEWVPRARLRYLAGGPAKTPPLAAGKYACTVSRYDRGAGGYVFDPKGTVVLLRDGRYQYLGFEKPSPGRYRASAATRVVSFTGGHLDGGEATPMVQRPGRFYLTAPRIGERWTCGLGDAK